MRGVSFRLLAATALLVVVSSEAGEGQEHHPQSAPADTTAVALVPERLDLSVPAEAAGEVFVRKFAVRVDNGKEFASILARVLDPKNHRWLSLRGSAKAITVVSPSTQVMEVSVDPGLLRGTSGDAEIEIAGARSQKLLLPVTLRLQTRPTAPTASGSPLSSTPGVGDASPPTGSSSTAKANPAPQPAQGQTAPAKAAENIPGEVTPRALSFVATPGAPAPPEQVLTVRLPVLATPDSPLVTYWVSRKAAIAANRGKAEPGQPPPPNPDWLILRAAPGCEASPTEPAASRCIVREGDKPTHRISVQAGNLAPGSYPAFVVFEGIDFKPIAVLVTLEVKQGS